MAASSATTSEPSEEPESDTKALSRAVSVVVAVAAGSAMRVIRETGAWESAASSADGFASLGRKNGADLGFWGGSFGLLRVRMVSRCRSDCQRDLGTRESVRR